MLDKIIPNFTLITLITSCASFNSNKEFTLLKDLAYTKDLDNVRLQGDLYLSKIKNAPIVFVVHGGGWSSRSKSDTENISESLASHGFNVFNINYRLAPKFKHPAAIDDLESAINFIKEKYPKEVDFSKIGLWGYSSGAHTVSIYGLTRGDKGVKAIVAGGGPYDFNWYPHSPYIHDYMGYYREGHLKDYLQASPISFVDKSSPSFFLYHGISDNLVEYAQMTNLEAKLKLKGVDVESYSVRFWGHINTFLFSKESIKRGVIYLQKRLQ